MACLHQKLKTLSIFMRHFVFTGQIDAQVKFCCSEGNNLKLIVPDRLCLSGSLWGAWSLSRGLRVVDTIALWLGLLRFES